VDWIIGYVCLVCLLVCCIIHFGMTKAKYLRSTLILTQKQMGVAWAASSNLMQLSEHICNFRARQTKPDRPTFVFDVWLPMRLIEKSPRKIINGVDCWTIGYILVQNWADSLLFLRVLGRKINNFNYKNGKLEQKKLLRVNNTHVCVTREWVAVTPTHWATFVLPFLLFF